MSAIIIDGKAVAESLRRETADAVSRLTAERGIRPGLAVVLVGADPASEIYVGAKVRQTTQVGMRSVEHRLARETTQSQLLALIAQLNADPEVDGILVQLPLPPHIQSQAIIEAIDPAKDVDGFHPVNAGRLATGLPGMVPCTPLGCLKLIKSIEPTITGLDAVVIGVSNIVGKPMAQLLVADRCTVTMTHSKTRHLAEVCRRADILVAAVGRAQMVRGDWIKPGAIVIDVGMNRMPSEDGKAGRVVGDVAFDEAKLVARAITPVPGGVGPMTIAYLLANTLQAAVRRRA